MRSVGIRLGTEGKAQVKADLQEIGTTGDAAFNRIAKVAKRSGEEAEAAIAKAARDIQKLETLMPGLNPAKLDMYAGTRDNIGKSAESSAAVFAAAYAKMEARAEHLREVIDPLYAAQKRHNAAIGEARTLLAAGVISLDDYSKMAWHLNQSLNGTGQGRKEGRLVLRRCGSSDPRLVHADQHGRQSAERVRGAGWPARRPAPVCSGRCR